MIVWEKRPVGEWYAHIRHGRGMYEIRVERMFSTWKWVIQGPSSLRKLMGYGLRTVKEAKHEAEQVWGCILEGRIDLRRNSKGAKQ